MQWLVGFGQFAWLFVLGGMILVSYVADRWARSDTSQSMQYAGLSLYVVAEAVLFMPLLYIASQLEMVQRSADHRHRGDHHADSVWRIDGDRVWITGANFNWMRNVLFVAGIAAFGAILCSIFMGFSLGIWFTAAMIAFACGWISVRHLRGLARVSGRPTRRGQPGNFSPR